MDRIPLRSGDFVWTLFPYDTEPESPARFGTQPV
jgi:hypothetical protein